MDAAVWDWPTDADRQRWRTAGRRDPAWTLWASRYERFRLAGPKRSLLSLYNTDRENAGKTKVTRTPSAWNQMAQWGEWRQRTALWDVEQLLKRRQEREAEEEQRRTQAREQRRRLIEASYAVILEALANVREKKVDDNVAVKLLSAISRHLDNSRREYGENTPPISQELDALAAAHDSPHERMVAEIQQVRRWGWENNDLRLVMQSLEMERDLLGLSKTTLQLEHTGENGGPIRQSRVLLYLPDNGRQPVPPGETHDGHDGH